eukprot:CFRG1432T1
MKRSSHKGILPTTEMKENINHITGVNSTAMDLTDEVIEMKPTKSNVDSSYRAARQYTGLNRAAMPSLEEQALRVHTSLKQSGSLVDGSEWHVISRRWWDIWSAAVSFKSATLLAGDQLAPQSQLQHNQYGTTPGQSEGSSQTQSEPPNQSFTDQATSSQSVEVVHATSSQDYNRHTQQHTQMPVILSHSQPQASFQELITESELLTSHSNAHEHVHTDSTTIIGTTANRSASSHAMTCDNDLQPTSVISAYPGPIDNSDILDTSYPTEIKRSIEAARLELVPANVGQDLAEWYGYVSGQLPLTRTVVFDGRSNGLRVEVIRLELSVCYSDQMQNRKIHHFSRACTIDEMQRTCMRIFNRSHLKSYRTWWLEPESERPMFILGPYNISIEAAMVNDGDSVVIEARGDDGFWSDFGQKRLARIPRTDFIPHSSKKSNHELSKKFLESVDVERVAIRLPGVKGLHNLGNTCYMNSLLQCLSNTELLTQYILSEQVYEDINRSNTLGSAGVMGMSFADVIDELWDVSIPELTVAPRRFKDALYKFAPQFCSYKTPDVHDVLTFLLSILHEDLNRIVDKPYVEMPTCDEYPDQHMLGEIFWNYYHRRNDSMITDIFQGQLRKTILCPDCRNNLVGFETFMHLSVPLTRWHISICVVVYSLNAPPQKHRIRVSDDAHVFNLIDSVSLQSNIHPNVIEVAIVENSEITKVLESSALVSKLNITTKVDEEAKSICIYEQADSGKRFNIIIQAQPIRDATGTRLVLPPVLISCQKTVASHKGRDVDVRELYANAAKAIKPLVNDEVWNNMVMFSKDGQQNSTSSIRSIGKMSESNVHNTNEIRGSVIGHHVTLEEYDMMSNSTDGDVHIDIDCVDGSVETGTNNEVNLLDFPFSLTLFVHSQIELGQFDQTVIKGRTVTVPVVGECAPKLYLTFAPIGKDNLYPSCCFEEPSLHASMSEHRDENTVSLYKCLDNIKELKRTDEKHLWYCDECKTHKQALFKYDLWRSSSVVILHLQRFLLNNSSKLEVNVDYPLRDLDLTFQMRRPSSTETLNSAIYELYAVVNHTGGKEDGHYTVYAKNSRTRTWNMFDDDVTCPIKESDIKSPNACILFYAQQVSDKSTVVTQRQNKSEAHSNCHSNIIPSGQCTSSNLGYVILNT